MADLSSNGPDGPDGDHGPWLARLLPRRMRTHVFEPAYRDFATDARDASTPLRVLFILGLVLDTYRVGTLPAVRDLFRRSSRFRWALVAVLATAVTMVAVFTTTERGTPIEYNYTSFDRGP